MAGIGEPCDRCGAILTTDPHPCGGGYSPAQTVRAGYSVGYHVPVRGTDERPDHDSLHTRFDQLERLLERLRARTSEFNATEALTLVRLIRGQVLK